MKLRAIFGFLLSTQLMFCATLSPSALREAANKNWQLATTRLGEFDSLIEATNRGEKPCSVDSSAESSRTPYCSALVSSRSTCLEIQSSCSNAQVPLQNAIDGTLQNPGEDSNVKGCLKEVPELPVKSSSL